MIGDIQTVFITWYNVGYFVFKGGAKTSKLKSDLDYIFQSINRDGCIPQVNKKIMIRMVPSYLYKFCNNLF